LIAILALTAFAAAIEGHLFAPMPTWQRALATAATVAVFWPSLAVEAAGAAIISLLIAGNAAAARR
jgi:TRAP-type uncharacterized transport system fused permease subunit